MFDPDVLQVAFLAAATVVSALLRSRHPRHTAPSVVVVCCRSRWQNEQPWGSDLSASGPDPASPTEPGGSDK